MGREELGVDKVGISISDTEYECAICGNRQVKEGDAYCRMCGVVFDKEEDKCISLPVAVEHETVRLSQAQMIELFGRDQSVISRHINNVFKEEEVDKKSNMHFWHIANADRPVAYYSLDVIISVGYRVKSKRGVEFRKWANSVLKQYIIKGYAVNTNRIKVSRFYPSLKNTIQH